MKLNYNNSRTYQLQELYRNPDNLEQGTCVPTGGIQKVVVERRSHFICGTPVAADLLLGSVTAVSPLSTYISRKIKKDTGPHSGKERLLV